jgi:nitronate monooxygenase
MRPDEIREWIRAVRAGSNGNFQINLWIPGAAPRRDPSHEQRVRDFLAKWGPSVPPEAADATPPDFAAQCEALMEANPPVISSIMGLFSPDFVSGMKQAHIAWFAVATTLAEARAAADAGADVIVAQGAEAGGHRGSFNADEAEKRQIGLFALLPAIADKVRVPIVATGGIADARGAAAALMLGASAVQIGTGFLRCPEAKIHPAWADAIARTAPENTVVTRAFSGRPGRSIETAYVRAATSPDAPVPAPYPVQRGLTAAMRSAAQKDGDVERMQVWAGQSAALAQDRPAGELAQMIWRGAQELVA